MEMNFGALGTLLSKMIGKINTSVQIGEQTLSPEQQAQVKENLGIEASAQAQADWNQNDPNGEGYIENRPGYYVEDITKNILSEVISGRTTYRLDGGRLPDQPYSDYPVELVVEMYGCEHIGYMEQVADGLWRFVTEVDGSGCWFRFDYYDGGMEDSPYIEVRGEEGGEDFSIYWREVIDKSIVKQLPVQMMPDSVLTSKSTLYDLPDFLRKVCYDMEDTLQYPEVTDKDAGKVLCIARVTGDGDMYDYEPVWEYKSVPTLPEGTAEVGQVLVADGDGGLKYGSIETIKSYDDLEDKPCQQKITSSRLIWCNNDYPNYVKIDHGQLIEQREEIDDEDTGSSIAVIPAKVTITPGATYRVELSTESGEWNFSQVYVAKVDRDGNVGLGNQDWLYDTNCDRNPEESSHIDLSGFYLVSDSKEDNQLRLFFDQSIEDIVDGARTPRLGIELMKVSVVNYRLPEELLPNSQITSAEIDQLAELIK